MADNQAIGGSCHDEGYMAIHHKEIPSASKITEPIKICLGVFMGIYSECVTATIHESNLCG